MSDEPPRDLAAIYDAYYRRVRSCAAKLLGADEAGDVANEVFVKIARSLHTLEESSKLVPWIFAITLNTVRDAARSRASRASVVGIGTPRAEGSGEHLPPLSEILDRKARTPEDSAVRSEMIACYLDYVERLPGDYRDVYVLSEFEELSNAEIAGRLSLTVGAVKIRLHRARARLYEELRRHCKCYVNDRGELMGEPKPEG